MNSAELQSMTVLQLRKLARENKVKLSAGIDKEGIVAKLSAALADAPAAQEAAPEQIPAANVGDDMANEIAHDLDKLQDAPLSADVTSVEPGRFKPVYRQAWQARPTVQREPGQKPAWSQPSRNAPNRFGPQPSMPSKIQEESEEERDERPSFVSEQRQYSSSDNAPRLDGYRLGYRAAPQRPSYQNRMNDYGGYQQSGGYRQNSYNGYQPQRSYQQNGYQQNGYQQNGYQQNGYQQNGYRQNGYQQNGYRPNNFGYQPQTPPESGFNDTVYRMTRDQQFAADMENGQMPELLQTMDTEDAAGVLEILPDGYGFLRGTLLLPGKQDVYVSMAQVRRYGLRTGDYIEGKSRAQRVSDKYAALLTVESVNGHEAVENPDRPSFEQLVPIYPNRRIVLENENGEDDEGNMVIRLVDLIAPIGFGQRAMIVCPPDCGRLTMLKNISSAIKRNDPDAEVLMLLIDVAPEEVTEIRESADAEVFATTFADAPDTQTRVSETMLERAMRLVEEGRNIVILLDSLTKLSRAYQSALVQGGRPITNSVTPAALVRPKRFFGAARNTRDAGSLTVVATIAVETGSRVDDIVFEEFKGTANMELVLCTRDHADPISPMINLQMSGTKKEDMLLNEEQKEGLRSVRKVLGSATNGEAVVQLIDMIRKTKCNADLFSRLPDWINLWKNSGYLKK